MHPKEKLRHAVNIKIEELPAYCQEDFCQLVSLLTRFKELAQEQEQHYQEWVAAVFRKNREQGSCGFCGGPLPITETDTPPDFCSADCQDNWKRTMLLVLTAYR